MFYSGNLYNYCWEYTVNSKVLLYRIIKLFIFISTFILILSSCDIVDAITDIFNGEDDDVINTVDPGYNLIGTQVIGSTGGEINLDSIIVNVPSGAFDESNEISISVGEENDGFDEYGISSLYQLSGLPSTLNKPIKISIKYRGTLVGDTLIAIGEMGYAVSLDSLLYSYHSDSASDSSGYLVYNMPANSGLARLEKSDYVLPTSITKVLIAVNTYKRTLSSKGNFRLHYPLFYEQQAIAMGEHFEKAYDKCLTMGFSYSARTSWPVNVLAKQFLPDKDGRIAVGGYSMWGSNGMTDEKLRSLINRGQFDISLSILSDDLELRATCGHEFLHLIQNLYEFSSGWIEPEQAWLAEATSVWIEEKYANITNYVSSSHVPVFPFWGWQYSDTKWSHADIGYGLSPIIKDIADRYGISEVVNIHKKIKEGILPNNAIDPVDAIKSIVEQREPLENFWHGVLSSYVLGDYYNSKVNFQFLDNSGFYSKTFTIDNSYTSDSFSYNYWDLSGGLVIVKPGDISSLATIPLSFSVDKLDCGILVCKYKKGTEITPIGEVYPFKDGIVLLDNVKPIFDSGYEIVVLVSNGSHDKSLNYQGGNQVILTIDLASDILNGSVRFFLDTAEFSRSDSPNPITGYLEEVLHLNGANGSFSNNVFNGIYGYQSLGRTFSGNIRVRYYDNPESIDVYLDNEMSYEASFGYGTRVFEYTVGYSGIPFVGIDPNSGQYLYADYGTSVNKIGITWEETNSLYIQKLKSFDCGADAYIEVKVDRRE